MTDITENTPASAFDLATDGGGRASLGGLKGKNIVLYFYPVSYTHLTLPTKRIV